MENNIIEKVNKFEKIIDEAYFDNREINIYYNNDAFQISSIVNPEDIDFYVDIDLISFDAGKTTIELYLDKISNIDFQISEEENICTILFYNMVDNHILVLKIT